MTTRRRNAWRWFGAATALLVVASLVLLATGQRWPIPALAACVGLCLAAHVDLPWGGRLTLGHAVVIAVIAHLAPADAAVVVGLGLVASGPTWFDETRAETRAIQLGGAASVAAAGLAAMAIRQAFVSLFGASLQGFRGLALATSVGVTFLVVDHGARVLLVRRGGQRIDLRQALPLALTILCVGVLAALTSMENVLLSPLAFLPLLIMRFAFQRYNDALTTYEQTTMALSLLPEVAGLTPLGHSERTAAYVEAVAPSMGFDPTTVNRLANVARLHHIADISLDEEAERTGPPDPAVLAGVAGEILRETGFLADLVDLVTDCQPGAPPASSLGAALVRVCSTLDDLVEIEGRIDPFAQLVSMHPVGFERTVAIGLLKLSHERPALVDEARASVAVIRQIAENARSGSHHDH